LLLKDTQVGVFFQRLGQVDQIAVSFGHQRSIRESRANGFGDVEGSRTCGNFLHAPVGELYMNAISHKKLYFTNPLRLME